MMAAERTKIVQRGLVLLVLIGALAVTVLSMMFRGTAPGSRSEVQPEPLIPLVCVVYGGFPGSLSWGVLYQLSEALPSAPGWEIRYTASEVLAKRGSPELPLAILGEMLDEQRQLRNFKSQLKDGRVVANEAAALNAVHVALQSFAEWHKHAAAVKAVGPDNPELGKLYRAVEKLTHSSNNVIRNRARETLLALKKN